VRARLLFLFLIASAVASAECLVIDTLTVQPDPPCATGTCTITGDSDSFLYQIKPSFSFTAHNSCKYSAPLKVANVWTVGIAFYDADNYRIGLIRFEVYRLGAGEKTKHSFLIPDDVIHTGKAVSAKVMLISDEPISTHPEDGGVK
jgi:hypothetical protein